MKIVVFDLGGTLMKYVGMPASWVEFYQQGFEAINEKFNCKISEEAIAKSVQMLKEYNPRVNYREIEYPAEQIFDTVLKHWNIEVPVQDCIETFWSGLHLKAEIFADTIGVLLKLKEKGYIIATLTDLPSAMPDEVFKRDIEELLKYFDYYVSSSVAGLRKPNCTGLRMISEKYNVPLEEIVFVGDEEKDRQTAKNANCKFIHIEREKECGDGVTDLREVLELLMKNTIDFTTITACGECCVGCKKKDTGFCKGCIESDGHCEEWAGSKGCPIYKCAKEHSVQFCGLCAEFPCTWLQEKVTWNQNIVEHLSGLADLYRKQEKI